MHLSIQFRHKATSTVSGEIKTVSDCAEAARGLQGWYAATTLRAAVLADERPIFTSDGSVDQLL